MKRNASASEKVFCLELKLLYLLSDPKQTFLMTLVLLGNTYKKIKVTFILHLHYKIRPLASDHLVQHTCIYISFGFDFINKGLTLPKVYCSPHCSISGFSAFGPFCSFVAHPKKGGCFSCSKHAKEQSWHNLPKGYFLNRMLSLYFVPWA